MDNKSQKIDWITPELVSHGDMSDITRGIPEMGNAKEVGGDDGGTCQANQFQANNLKCFFTLLLIKYSEQCKAFFFKQIPNKTFNFQIKRGCLMPHFTLVELENSHEAQRRCLQNTIKNRVLLEIHKDGKLFLSH